MRPVFEGILDLIAPTGCVICEGWGKPLLCDECAAQIACLTGPCCARCGRPCPPDVACRACAEQEHLGGWRFESARATAIYEGVARQLVHHLKFRGVSGLGPLLGEWMAERIVQEKLLTFPPDVVIFVPLHPRRERERGYNQTRLLAEPVAARLGLACEEVLIRTRCTPHQVGLSNKMRRDNVSAEQFDVGPQGRVADRRFLLIDDVFTTGTTANSCAGALRHHGARSVQVITLTAGG